MRVPDSPAGSLASQVAMVLRRAGFSAYFVGGCVRDLLLNIEPKDFDIATSAAPDEVCRLFPNADRIGAHFGVVLIHDEKAQVEVATYRSDHVYRDGRRPESVTFETDPRQDVLRRDFTINALLLDPETSDVLDYTGGQDDLRRGVIRTVGEPSSRFQEDHLRMMRAVRFAARLGFTVDPATLASIRELRASIEDIAAERVRDELIRILTEGGARRGFELLDESGLLEITLREVAAMKGVEQPPKFHPEGDVWIHTLMMLELLRNPTPTLALGALLHDVGKPPTFCEAERIRFDGHPKIGAEMAVEILQRLRCSNDQIRQVEALVTHHLRFMHAHQMRPSTLKRFMRLEQFEEHLELHRLDCLASHRKLDNYEFVKTRFENLEPEELKPRPLLTGYDLMQAGYKAGPAFGKILKAVETAQLDGDITTREEALDLVRSIFSPPEGRRRS